MRLQYKGTNNKTSVELFSVSESFYWAPGMRYRYTVKFRIIHLIPAQDTYYYVLVVNPRITKFLLSFSSWIIDSRQNSSVSNINFQLWWVVLIPLVSPVVYNCYCLVVGFYHEYCWLWFTYSHCSTASLNWMFEKLIKWTIFKKDVVIVDCQLNILKILKLFCVFKNIRSIYWQKEEIQGRFRAVIDLIYLLLDEIQSFHTSLSGVTADYELSSCHVPDLSLIVLSLSIMEKRTCFEYLRIWIYWVRKSF